MAERLLLDATPLSLLCQRHTLPVVVEIRTWLAEEVRQGNTIYVPEIADYEVRRELLRARKEASVGRLELLIRELAYVRLETSVMRRAAELWALARNAGQPTAPPEALDGDVILAAQAESVGGIVVTSNPGHLSRFVSTVDWRQRQSS